MTCCILTGYMLFFSIVINRSANADSTAFCVE